MCNLFSLIRESPFISLLKWETTLFESSHGQKAPVNPEKMGRDALQSTPGHSRMSLLVTTGGVMQEKKNLCQAFEDQSHGKLGEVVVETTCPRSPIW